MQDFKTIQSIGKAALIEKLKANRPASGANIVQGIGDDAAVIKTEPDSLTVMSSDIFAEGVHFDLTYHPVKQLGYKIVAASVSNILAMNGIPEYIMVNIAVPNRQSVQMIQDLYEGIYHAGSVMKVEVVGGDLSPNHANMVISVSVFGKADPHKITYRRGAEIGHAICVTGDLGSSLAGLRVLSREKKHWDEHADENIQPDLADYEYVIRRQLMPEARLDVIEALEQHRIIPSSMTDLKQSLIHGVNVLAAASGKGAYLYQAALPIALETRQVADEMQEEVDKYALFGGEDFELMFTLPEEQVNMLFENFKDFTVIGRMVPVKEGFQMQTAEGDVVKFDDLS